MSDPTELYLPQTFPYPIKVVSLDARTTTNITRGTRLLTYSFLYATGDRKPETRFGTWDSATEGELKTWRVKQGDLVTERRAREQPVALIVEPCKHGVQIGGLCGLCGKDMTDPSVDYTGFSDASRASIQMSHSSTGPMLSLEEAQKLERETADHLLKSRKLSLIVDLDQTIVHATVDPTVGEWITAGEAWEARRAKRAEDAADKDSDDSSDEDLDSQSEDECDPNWEALKDVKKFRLGPEAFGWFRPPGPAKGKQNALEYQGCMYYIKPRPGWEHFLEATAAKYQMHIYTMGTRAYAEEVCAAIDPDGKLFGGRILSRDESGSLTQKSLRRLFPCDTSMVVIIDDRADVWEWSPNLVKVIPYDFFVGIGDINSTFLPKAATPPPILNTGTSSPAPTTTSPAVVSSADPTPLGETDATTKAILTQNALAIEAQLEQRPLAKKQVELSEAEAKEEIAEDAKGHEPSLETPKPEKHVHKALLKNDDVELERVSKILDEVHRRFYDAYDSRASEENLKKRKHDSINKSREGPQINYDVTRIIPQLRSDILDGVHILFSSVIPLDTNPETTEIWRMAHIFGATCHTELNSSITHVVAARPGTVKVDAARKRGRIKIVWFAWLRDCMALWRRLEETPYLLDEPPATVGLSSSPAADDHQISSDPDPDTDDWDENDDGGAVVTVAGAGGGAEPKSFEIEEINWNDINDEVDAAMNESDDEEDGRSDVSAMRSIQCSEDEESGSDRRVETPSKAKRKRQRSATPSESGRNYNPEKDALTSPLSKRRKVVSERSGYSKLKHHISAADLSRVDEDQDEGRDPLGGGTTAPLTTREEEMDDGDNEESSGDEDDDEDDFLAREMEEEWG